MTPRTVRNHHGTLYWRIYLLALVDSLAVVLLESLVFFFCWVAEGFLSSCSSGSGAGGSLWSASELPLLVLGLSSSDLCLSLDIVGNFLGEGEEKRRGRVSTTGRTVSRHSPSSKEHLNWRRVNFTAKLTKIASLSPLQGLQLDSYIAVFTLLNIQIFPIFKPTRIFFIL